MLPRRDIGSIPNGECLSPDIGRDLRPARLGALLYRFAPKSAISYNR